MVKSGKEMAVRQDSFMDTKKQNDKISVDMFQMESEVMEKY